MKLALNIDGILIFKSTNEDLWPILCAIMNLTPLAVFLVALAFRNSKLDNNDFLLDTLKDMKQILQHGVQYGNMIYTVTLSCITCDAPAEALVKSIKLHSRYYGCDHCTQKGLRIGRMTSPKRDGIILKTDESFRSQTKQTIIKVDPFSVICQ